MKTETKIYKNAIKDKINTKKRNQRLWLMGIWLIINVIMWGFIPHTEKDLTNVFNTLALFSALFAIFLPWRRLIKTNNNEIEQHLKKTLTEREKDIKDHKQTVTEIEQEIMELHEEEDSDEIIADILDSKQEIIEFKKEILEFIQECIDIKETLETTSGVEDLKKEYTLLDKEVELLTEQQVELTNRFQVQD
ncbi:MAG: hypothetical protein WCO66_00655 [Candidatus Absconditabacteria bacterium]